MRIDENLIYVFNPDYVLRNDIHRIALYAKENANSYSSRNWNSFIHPIQAKLFCFFTYRHTLGETVRELSAFFKKDIDTIVRLITPYLENPSPIYVSWKGKRILFPKNILIREKCLTIPFVPSRLNIADYDCQDIDLESRRFYSGPLMITFMLTNTCVTHCIYCYADIRTRVEHPLSTSRWLELIQEADQMQVRQINLIGGEIFLHKDWDLLLKELVSRGMSPEYISTKMPFTKDLIVRLRNTGYRNSVQVSLDAYDSDILSRSLSVDKGYLERMKRGLRLLDESGLSYHVATVLHTYNGTEKVLRDLYDFLLSLHKLRNWRISPVVNSITIDYKQFATFKLRRSQLEMLSHYMEESLSPESPFPILFNRMALDKSYYTSTIGSRGFEGAECSALNTHLFILPDGKVSICEQLYWNPIFLIGEVNTSSLKEIWISDKNLRLAYIQRENIQKSSPCRYCKLFDHCFSYRNRCWVDIIKAYGEDYWDYPDPRCEKAYEMRNNLDYE